MTQVAIYFSDYFDTGTDAVEEYGAFDIALVNDLPLFVDPFLLFNSEKQEYQALHDQIIRYMRFLKGVSLSGAIPKGLVESWFTFREVKQNWLGYSLTENRGRGLGTKFAESLSASFRTVFKDFGEETLTQGSHLEKLCLIRDGVGRDNISDFTTNLIKGHLASYTERFATGYLSPEQRRRVSVDKVKFNYDTRSWVSRTYELPWFEGDYVLLTPKDMLSKDQTWINRPELLDRFSEIAEALPNPVLRAQVNDYLLRSIPKGREVTAKEIREAVALAADRFPQVLDYYVLEKENSGDRAESLSRMRVQEVEERFVEQVRTLVSEYLAPGGFYAISGDTYDEARARLDFLKHAIEDQGAHKIFYHKGQAIRKESDLQILYRLTWFATPSDVSREVNDGRGPADFKISRGAPDKTVVELKLASNSRLERNLEKQAELYAKASDSTQPPIKVILYFTASECERVTAILKRLKLTDSRHIVLIDARDDNKPSASTA